MSSSGVVVVGLGDSITAGNPLWDPDPHKRPQDGGNPESQYLYWAARADPRIEFRNCGVGGERTDQILARLDSSVEGASVLVVQGGINDVVQKRSIDEAAANLGRMVQLGKGRGLAVVLIDVFPWNRGWPDAEGEIRRLNDLEVMPFHDTLEDPDRPGRMREDWTDDGNHPSIAGYRRLGELAFVLPD
jgi:lysophospholipase L1-like esterase